MHVVRKIASLLVMGIACALLVACHGSSTTTNSGQAPKATFSYVATGLSVAFNATGSTDPDGSTPAYSWNFGDGSTDTVLQPTHIYAAPGSYTVSLMVTGEGNSVDRIQTVTVVGGTAAGLENWTWVADVKYANSFGTYETAITPSAANAPSARQNAVSWTDGQGQLWLFGGSGYDSTGNAGLLNDLWRFNPTSEQWAWVNGSNRVNSEGSYGEIGQATSINMPGARTSAASWTDSSGNFWLFGGSGYGSTATLGSLNDLWIMNSLTGAATWVAGSNTVNAVGSYGVQGVASPSNMPGARSFATTWTDKKGKLWLFGGQTSNAAGTIQTLNDLWMFDPNPTSCPATPTTMPCTASPTGRQWTWMGGSATAVNVAGAYGTQGVGSTANLPGGRQSAQGWTDAAGNLWLFGGSGYDSAGAGGVLNDLWSFNPTTGAWTWVTGSKVVGGAGVYGNVGIAATGNTPSARLGTAGWTDSFGTLWLFGGGGFGSTGISTTTSVGVGELSDLWNFNPATGQWAWMGGPTTAGVAGTYATAQDIASNLSNPGARMWSTGWTLTDADGNSRLWLFGGAGVDSAGTAGYLSDLWNAQLILRPQP